MIRRESAAIAAIMVLAFAARLIPGARAIDDAYITFRYARNIVAGNGFVYNTGERVLGTTTPLFTLLMSAEAALAGQRDADTGLPAGFPELALLTNALADAASAWILYRLGRRLSNGPLVGLAAALLWAVNPFSVTFAVGGMETSVFIALTLGTFLAYLEDRWRAAGLLAALALLTRPEAVIAIGLITLDAAARWATRPSQRSELHLREAALAMAIVLLPWVVFSTAYFGNPIPGSVAAKGVAYQLPPTQALVAFLRTFVAPFSGVGSFDAGLGVGLLVLYLALFAFGALRAIRRQARAWPMFAFAMAYVAAYVVANPLVFRWYVTPPLPIFILGIVLGWGAMTALIRRAPLARLAFASGVLLALAGALGGWSMPDHSARRLAPSMAYIKTEDTYFEAAEQLKSRVGPDTVIAAGDIGSIGYATDAHIYDTLGLITPDARRYYPVPPEAIVPPLPYAIPAQLILDAQPDYIVIMEAYGRNTFLRDSEFRALYAPIGRLDTDATRDYSSDGMLIFERREE